MNKNATYLIIAIIIPAFYAFENLLNPRTGRLTEEVLAIVLIFVGFLVLNKPTQRLVRKLNEHLPWEKKTGKRIGVTFAMLAVATTLGTLLLMPLHDLVNQFDPPGPPHEQGHRPPRPDGPPPPRDEGRWPPPRDERGPHRLPPPPQNEGFLTDFMVGSAFFFILLLGMEEVFEMTHQQQQLRLKNEQLAKEQALSRFEALKNQLNPHFMFNSLNVLSGLMYEDVGKADKFVKELARIYRYVLDQSGEVVTTVAQELGFVEAYIYLQQMRLEDLIEVHYEIEGKYRQWFIPPLTLELVVENVIKHNQITPENPMTISIRTANDHLIVSNPFRPRRDKPEPSSIGQQNLAERLQLLGLPAPTFLVEHGHYVATIPMLENLLE